MATASRQQILGASRQWLQPLTHVLIRGGITWREFAELARAAYVNVATQKFGKRGRPTNVSRTAVLTGLSRRDVRKQRELLTQAPPVAGGYVTKASLVLSTWHLDAEFLDKKGQPATLPIEGERRSFAALVQRCAGGDVPMTTLLKELIDAGAVRLRGKDRLQVLQRSYIPHPLDEQLVRLWGSVLTDIATTYVHNLTKAPKLPARFERAAVNDRIDARALPEFRKFLEHEGQAFLERIDAWLTAHQVAPDSDRAGEAIRLGVGTYHIQDE
jgi:hypothetical protein